MKTPFLIRRHNENVAEVRTMDEHRVSGVIHLRTGPDRVPYERKFNVKHDGRRFLINLYGGSSGGNNIAYWFKDASKKS